MADDYGEGTARWTAVQLLSVFAGFAIAIVYMPDTISEIPMVRVLFVLMAGGAAGLLAAMVKSALFPRNQFERIPFALVRVLFTIAWHKSLYKLGLVENSVEDHYGKLSEDR